MPAAKKLIIPSEASTILENLHDYGVNMRSREIFFVDYKGDNEDEAATINARSAMVFLKNLSVLEQLGRSKITVYLHTVGGSWFDGMAVYNAIRAAKSQITMVVCSQAESMGGVVFQAADRRIMMPDSYLMLHHGSIGFDSMASQAASEFVKLNDAGCKKMLNIFASKAQDGPFFSSKRWGVQKITEFFDKEMKNRGDWYINAQEAVDFGLADTIQSVVKDAT